jgi:hypothetical protein
LAVKFLEEPDLVSELGDEYETYKKNTPMYCPFSNCKLMAIGSFLSISFMT